MYLNFGKLASGYLQFLVPWPGENHHSAIHEKTSLFPGKVNFDVIMFFEDTRKKTNYFSNKDVRIRSALWNSEILQETQVNKTLKEQKAIKNLPSESTSKCLHSGWNQQSGFCKMIYERGFPLKV